MKKSTTFILLILFSSFLFSFSVSARPVPDTGQTKCYDNSGEIPCPQPGEPFYGQDASYAINPPSYTKLDAIGNDLPDDATEWVMVRDNVTGLIWEVKRNKDDVKNYDDPHDADNTYTWYDSTPETNGGNAGTPGNGTDTEDFIKSLNEANFGGFSDWRLPTIKELSCLVKWGTYDPAIDTDYFPKTVSINYWSSTTIATVDSVTWHVHFQYGSVHHGDKSWSWYVRAVRGGQCSSRFINNGDGTVTDISTGLMWQQETAGTMVWGPAITYCEDLSLAGYDDWRLPNINELQSLVDYSKTSPAIDTSLFPDTVCSNYWSSTTDAYIHYVWRVDFNYGYIFNDDKSRSYDVRAVRGGQSRGLGNLIISNPDQAGRLSIGYENTVTWDTGGIAGNVRILLSRQGGKEGTFEVISDETPNDGSFTWTVTGPESFNCALRIEPLGEPGKGTTQGLFSICTLHNAWIETQGGPDVYRLTLYGCYTDGYVPLEAAWSVSDTAIAGVSNNILIALQNGRVEITASYEGHDYSAAVFVYNTFDAMETEPNNTKEAPYVSSFPIADGTFYQGSFPDGDVDFFKFTLASDSILDIGYLSYSTTADMNIELFDDYNTLMASSVSTNGSPEVLPVGLPSGIYYLKLLSAGDYDQDNYYVVTYKILETMPSKSTIELDMGQTGQGTIYNLEDEAMFSFTLEETKAVRLLFTPEISFAKYLIELLDNSQTVIDKIECLEDIPVSIEAVFEAGSYTVRVTPVDNIDAARTFSLEMTESTNQLEAEPNNNYQQATAFDISRPIQGRLYHNQDQDFFEFTLLTPAFLELAFNCPGSSKASYLNLYKESDQNLIDAIKSAGGSDVSLHMGLGVGRYYIKVTSDGLNAETIHPYQLTIADSTQTNLEIESNNTITVANAIEKDCPRKGRVFSTGDTDYYGFHLSALGLFNIAFSTGSGSGDYKVSLVDENDQSIDYRNSVNGASCNMNAYQPPGNFYIKIEADGDIDQYSQYELTLTSSVDIEGIKKIVSVIVTGLKTDMMINETQTLSAMTSYSDATSEAIAGPVWSSLDSSVATVNTSGLVTAIAEGTTTIVATHGGLTGSFDIKVGSPAQVFSQHYGNLIVVAGSGASESDPLTESAQYLANLFYQRFQTRLFRHEDIFYFNPVAGHDLDGDGYDDNIVDDTSPTVAEFDQAIIDWAAGQDSDGPLFIYLVGHGEIDSFNFPGETLTAQGLKGFLDTFQASTGRQVIVIIEACKSGSFTNDLVSSGANRVVVTSTDNQDSYLKLGGRISFTQFFIDKLFGGGSIYEAWQNGSTKLSEMELPFSQMAPQLAEGVYLASNQIWVGGEFVIASVFPGWIMGKVYDSATGFALENAIVSVDGIGDFNTIDGGYFLCEVPTGIYTVSATCTGYDPLSYPGIVVNKGDSIIKSFGMVTESDSDNDMMPDDWEIAYFGDISRDGTGDYDSDALTDLQEYEYGTDPTKTDTDEDSLNDGDEVKIYGTNPGVMDTDTDGMTDGWEVQYGLDPLVNNADDDADDDGYSNLQEFQAGTEPNNGDDFPNQAPIANAGSDQTVDEGDTVTLDGSNSYDSDDGIASYLWAHIIGPSVTLSDPAAITPTFTAPDVDLDGESLTFELTVTDNGGLQSTDTCIVNVTWVNIPPIANAGPDQTVDEGDTVTLDGSNSSDTDDGISFYIWTQLHGTQVELSNPNAAQPTFVGPDVDPDGESLTFELTVTDEGGLQSTDTCIVNVTWVNIPPIADAGSDQTVDEGAIVTLDGSSSYDSDDGIATYEWTQTAGTSVTLSDPASSQPTLISPDVGPEGESLTFELTVTDEGGLQSTDTCIVDVIATEQLPLNMGWNLISIYLQPDEPNIAAVLEDISDKVISVWAYMDGNWQVYDPENPGFSDLETMEAGRGYWLHLSESATLDISGITPSGSINLSTGWNLVGYNASTSQDIPDALESIDGNYISVWAYMDGVWKVYDPANPGFSDLNTMLPGYGYWINAKEACMWILP
jgi:hypothetical protein